MNLGALKRALNTEKSAPAPQPEVVAHSVPTIVVRNSFCRLSGFDEAAVAEVRTLLTYKDEGVERERAELFRLLHVAKARGNSKMQWMVRRKLEELKDREWVCWLDERDEFPTGHLGLVRGVLGELGVDPAMEDHRRVPRRMHELRWKVRPPEPRYYQREMVDLGKAEGRGVFESAVGSGKSLVLTYLLQELGVTSLVVLPSGPLTEQLHEVLTEAFGKRVVQVVTTKRVVEGDVKAPIRLVTVQTLASINAKGLLPKLVSDVDLLAVDEVHHAGASSYVDLLPQLEHVYYRFGFTGTFLRNDYKTLDLWGFLSNVLYYYPPHRATKEGFLTPVEFHTIELSGAKKRDYQKEYSVNYLGQPMLLEAIRTLLSDIPSTDQVLILVDRKEAGGRVIHDYLAEQGVDTTYVSGDDDRKTIARAISDFNDRKVRVLIGSTVIGEGIDVRSTQHLIMARGGKSEISVVQAIGRCVRLSPGKKLAKVYDFRFKGTKYLEKHWAQRQATYRTWFGLGAEDDAEAASKA